MKQMKRKEKRGKDRRMSPWKVSWFHFFLDFRFVLGALQRIFNKVRDCVIFGWFGRNSFELGFLFIAFVNLFSALAVFLFRFGSLLMFLGQGFHLDNGFLSKSAFFWLLTFKFLHLIKNLFVFLCYLSFIFHWREHHHFNEGMENECRLYFAYHGLISGFFFSYFLFF